MWYSFSNRDMPTHFTFYNRDRERGGGGGGEASEAPSEGHLYNVLEFLIEHQVLKREVRGGEERFHLSRFWKVLSLACLSVPEHFYRAQAEEGIVCGLEEVL